MDHGPSLLGSWYAVGCLGLIGCVVASPGADPDAAAPEAEDVANGEEVLAPPDDTGRLVDAEPDLPLEIEVGEAAPCAVPEGEPGRYVRTTLPRQATPLAVNAGAGLSVADLSGDGLLDVVTTDLRTARWFEQQTDGSFDLHFLAATPSTDVDGWFGPSVADFDGDGDADVFLAGHGVPNRLMVQVAPGEFEDRTAQAGLAGPEVHASSMAAWADMDGDGDLDLAVGGLWRVVFPRELLYDPVLLYENLGDGTFADRSSWIPEEVRGVPTFVASWVPLREGERPDLYLGPEFAEHGFRPALLRWEDAAYTVVSEPRGLDAPITSMGLGVGDVNGDGVHDFVLPGFGELGLLVSEPSGWFERAAASGLVPDEARGQHTAWAGLVTDLDNDGLVDIVVAYGTQDDILPGAPDLGDAPRTPQPDAVFRQTSPLRFEDVAPAWGLDDTGSTRGTVVVDLDGDGWQDILRHGPDGDVVTIDRSACGAEAWTSITLSQDGPNPDAIGARIEVEAAGTRHVRWVTAGGVGYAGSSPPVVHVGLGGAELIGRVRVQWPDGTWTVARDVPVRRPIRARY